MAPQPHVASLERPEHVAMLWIEHARNDWEKSGRVLNEYLADRNAFYAHVREHLLPRWINQGEDRDVFDAALRAYARGDWIRAGRDPHEFDAIQVATQQDMINRANREKYSGKGLMLGFLYTIIAIFGWIIIRIDVIAYLVIVGLIWLIYKVAPLITKARRASRKKEGST